MISFLDQKFLGKVVLMVCQNFTRHHGEIDSNFKINVIHTYRNVQYVNLMILLDSINYMQVKWTKYICVPRIKICYKLQAVKNQCWKKMQYNLNKKLLILILIHVVYFQLNDQENLSTNFKITRTVSVTLEVL